MKFFIFGHGSIGTRHQKNLITLGHQEVSDLKKADCALVCNPTALHLSTALKATKLNLVTFIEKPLSHNLDGVDQIEGKILLGYCLRFDQSLKQFKERVDRLDKSKIKSVKIVAKSWLPDWHPGSDYTQSYSAKKELGGGVLLDLSHEIDYALWFFGPIESVMSRLQKSPELKIETEAIADLNLRFQTGVNAEINLSYASHENERYCEIVTDSETLRWNFKPNNEMYIEEMKHFIDIVTGKEKPLITVNDGRRVLKVIETAKMNNL